MSVPSLTIIGGGLAGSEAALQAAKRGIQVTVYEMRPHTPTGAHLGGDLAELVCSNSLGSRLPDRASGVLKNELRQWGSALLEIAEQTALPAGAALAVDRAAFSARVTQQVQENPNIRVLRTEVQEIPAQGSVIIASGPLTSASLSQSIARFTRQEHLFFYDAIAPIVEGSSIDFSIAYRASRWEEEGGDYINCPFHRKEDYLAFVQALREAERIDLRAFERPLETGVQAGDEKFFEGCLPVEIIARRGERALAFGPMRPVGLNDPRVPRRPYAVVQLRQDNLAGNLYNLVGFQTNLTFTEQKRVFRMIPGLEKAEFVRYGQMHRNTFIASPQLLLPTLQTRSRPNLFFAGQITGVEGYLGNIATGLLAGCNAARLLQGQEPLRLPRETMLGALCHYVTHADMRDFQPMKANFGILPPLPENTHLGKRERAALYAQRAADALENITL